MSAKNKESSLEVMLSFARLSRGQQRAFLELMNAYLFASSPKQQELVRVWSSESPVSAEMSVSADPVND